MTLTPNAERLALELSLPVSNTQPSACLANAITHCGTAAASNSISIEKFNVVIVVKDKQDKEDDYGIYLDVMPKNVHIIHRIKM